MLNPRSITAPDVRDALKRAGSPLSDCQQRVWRLATADPRTMWAEKIALRFSGALRIDTLDRALEELIRRQAILRTVFVALDGEPLQCVRSTTRAGLLVVDLEMLDPDARHRASIRLARLENQSPIDIRRAPLMRAVLIRVTPTDHVLVLVLHHLIFDGWSQSVMFRELAALYMAFTMNLRSPLPELRVQYADLARREQDASAAARRDARLAEWMGRLRGLRSAATLPLDRPRPAHTSHRADAVPFVLPDEASRAIRAVGDAEGVTMFMIGLAAVALTVRVTVPATEDVTVGVALANRNSVDAQALIGPFVNILPVRLSTHAEMTVRELLRSARTAMLDAFAFQDVPFDRVMQTLHPGVPLGSYGPKNGEPLFRICVDFTDGADADSPAAAGSTLTVAPFHADDAVSGCDLYVSFSGAAGTMRGFVVYSAELFDRGTITAFLDRMRTVLGTLDRQLNRRLSQVRA
jgi:hypothetical protein